MNEGVSWRYWLVTDLFLATGLLLWPPAIYGAMAVTVVHGVHCLARAPGITRFPMQVRIGYLGLLLLGQLPYFGWIHWVQLFGTTALLTTGYCPLARMMSLLPWNRNRPLNWHLVARALFTPPVSGSILAVVSTEPGGRDLSS